MAHDLPKLKGMYPYGHCGMGSYVHHSNVFTDSEGLCIYEIQQFNYCARMRVLYILECPCKKMYVGKTKCQLRIRFDEHVKSFGQGEDTPVALHFAAFHGGQPYWFEGQGYLCSEFDKPKRRL